MKKIKWSVICLTLILIGSLAHAAKDFGPRFAGQQTVDGANSLAVTFSHPVDASQDLNTYFTVFTEDDVAVEGGWVLSADPKVVYFSNIEPDTKYLIRIHKGLKAVSGSTLQEAKKFTVKTRQIMPMISFGSKGFILPSRMNRGLPVNTLNIDRADIDFFRVKPRFVAQFTQHFTGHDQIYYYMNEQLHTFTELVYSGRWDLEIKKDLRTQVNIPITHIKELSVPGIYFAVLKGAGQYEYNYNTTWFTISDLGLHARRYENRLQFHVQSLESAKPVKGAAIQGYGKKGELIFDVATDENGVALADSAPAALNHIIARSGRHITFLPMDVPVLDLSEFRTAVEPYRPIDLYVYGPRDLYRPGETLVIDGLLRNRDGRMTAALPLSAGIIRPDGRMVHEFLWKGEHYNHYHYEYALNTDAITGKWRITFKHGADTLKEYTFHVADFLPERMKLQLSNPPGQADILTLSDEPAVKVEARFLYGAPAAGVRSDAAVRITPARELFKQAHPGFLFGDITEKVNLSFDSDPVLLNPNGIGRIPLKNQWQDAQSPLKLTANTSVYDTGGRPVARNRSWQVWPAEQLVGIRPMSEDGTVKSDSTARFEVIVTDKKGSRLKGEKLKAVVIKEHREYYWEYRNDAWQWDYTSHFYPIDQFTVTVPENGAAEVLVPVEWGGYRLEITHPETGLVSSVRFQTQWHPDGMAQANGAGRPDRVVLTLDKPGYRAGDTVRVNIKAPQEGRGYLFVESDTNLMTIPVEVPPEGKSVEFDISPLWARHDLYVSALIVRKGDAQQTLLPKRAVGLVHLPLDRSGRKLLLTADIPAKTTPNQTLSIDLNVAGPDGASVKNAFVTLALVDVGILNLTGFKTPSPHSYFFQDRRYAVQMHDIYQKLIEANKGAWARQRFGGDAIALSRGGDKPSTDVRIISITHKAVQTDPAGRASFLVDLPDFNGTLRVMAVAHTGHTYGSFEQEMVVAAPVVTQITMPRFLSMGDKSRVAIDIHNLTGTPQQMDAQLAVTGPISLTSEAKKQVTLAADQKTTLLFDVFAGQQIGRAAIDFTLDGIQADAVPDTLSRSWYLETRPPYPAWTKIARPFLEPGQAFSFEPADMSHLIKETVSVRAVLSSLPPINLTDHIRQLDAYPYGCLEQTVSGIFPHVILSQADMAALGIKGQSSAATEDKIRLGIRRLMEKQKSTGGFGLWSSNDRESFWLTAYAADFLIHARQAGFDTPSTMVDNALKRLTTYVRRPGSVRPDAYTARQPYTAATRAYAAFVLARVQSLSLGEARALYSAVKKDLETGLSMVHMALALHLCGDRIQAQNILKQVVAGNFSRTPRRYLGDYGSELRDSAAAFFLVSSFYPQFSQKGALISGLQEELNQKQWFSTQERNALVLAGSIAMRQKGKTWQADVKQDDMQQTLTGSNPRQVVTVNGESAGGFTIVNTGSSGLYLSAVLSGYPAQQPVPEANGLAISRRYLTAAGDPVPAGPIKSGTRMIVELSFHAEHRLPNALLTDLLPAGLESEDPAIAGSMAIDDIKVDNKSIRNWHAMVTTQHTEYRDDRFAAALNIPGNQELRYFYPVRAVSPGHFLIPPPLAEDMYQPSIRAVGETTPLMQVELP